MGKPKVQEPYRDDPDAVSMHTTPDDYEYADGPEPVEELPSYDDSEAAASSSSAAPAPREDGRARSVAAIEPYQVLYYPGRTNDKGEITIRMSEELTDPTMLHEYLNLYLRAAPPRPLVRLHGWHYETVRRKDKKEQERVTDFDIRMSFQPYLSKPLDKDWWNETIAGDADTTYRGGWRKTRAPGYKPGISLDDDTPQRTLMDWCEDYCASPAKLKVFRVNREVIMRTSVLKPKLENLVRSTQYRGHVDVTFPIEGRTVDIYTPHAINKWRTSWIRYIFYITFLWIITWPILFFTTKWWDVYTVTWFFSNPFSGLPATISEEQWFEKHKALIRELVMNKYTGESDCAPSSDDAPARQQQRQMPQTGNANVDSAIGFIQSGVNVWNAVSSGRDPNDQSWGYDR